MIGWIYSFFFERDQFKIAICEMMIGWILKLLPYGEERIEFAYFIATSRWFKTAPGRWRDEVDRLKDRYNDHHHIPT